MDYHPHTEKPAGPIVQVSHLEQGRVLDQLIYMYTIYSHQFATFVCATAVASSFYLGREDQIVEERVASMDLEVSGRSGHSVLKTWTRYGRLPCASLARIDGHL